MGAGSLPVTVRARGIFTLGGILVLLFGVIGLVFGALNKPVLEILALVMGILVMLFSLLMGALVPTASVVIPGASASVTPGFGMWISLVGGLLLTVGGALGFVESRNMPAPPRAP